MMTLKRFAAVLAFVAVFAPAAQASDVPVAYSNVTELGGVTTPAFAYDGVFPNPGQAWTDSTAWWSGTDKSLVFQFDTVYEVKSIDVSLDNNDSYSVQFSLDGNDWGSTVHIGSGEGSVGWGMDRFQRSVTPTLARYARVFATDGDSLYSVGELQIAAAVPEPETYAMLLVGLGLLGGIARRGKQ